MKKRSISLVLNLLIISFELVGFIFSYLYNHRIAIEFYTECSNILMLVCSMVFVYYMVYNKSIPKWLHYFKYLSTTCVSITFFVVLFILIPMGNFDYYAFLFNGTLLFHHTLCPILAIITFLFFDNLKVYKKNSLLVSLSFTLLYGLIAIILNILNIIEGPYPFLMVKKQPFLISIIWFIIIVGFAYVIAYILKQIHTKVHKEVLDIYDDNGIPTGNTVLRGSDDSAFKKHEHFAVSVIFIENNKGQFLIQKLPNGSYSSTGGHVLSGEAPINAIIREVKEEIGVKLNKKDIKYLGFKTIDLPIRFLFYIKKNININRIIIDPNEVYSVEYMDVKEIKQLIKNKQMKESHAILFKEVLKNKEK